MSRYLPITDFRARRRVLVRSDFVIAEAPQPRPADLIDEKVWRSIVTLPDDVAIRTSNHHGTTLAQLDELSSAWLFSMRMPPHRERMFRGIPGYVVAANPTSWEVLRDEIALP